VSENKCPMNYGNHDCNKCPGQFEKEELCDWPYALGICPKINECGEINMVLDKDLSFDAIYAECMKEVCRNCGEAERWLKEQL